MSSILETAITFSKKPVILNLTDDERFRVDDIAEYYSAHPYDDIIIKGKIDMILSPEPEYLYYVRNNGMYVQKISKEKLWNLLDQITVVDNKVILPAKQMFEDIKNSGYENHENREIKNITLFAIRTCITHSTELFLRQDDEFLYLIIRNNNNRYSKTRFDNLIKFLKDENNWKKIKPIDEFPKTKLSRQSTGTVNIITEEYMFKKYVESTEKILEEANKRLEKAKLELISLAPPKDGHVLQLIAAGAADGQYGNILIKGQTDIVEQEEYDEEDNTIYKVEIPKVKIIALDLITKEMYEIVQ